MCFMFTLAAQLVFLSDSCELQGYRPVIRAPDLCLAGQKMGAPSDMRAFSVTLDCMCNMMEKKNRLFSCWLRRSTNDPQGGTGSAVNQV